ERAVVRSVRDQHGVRTEHLVDAEQLETARGNGHGSSRLQEGAAAERHDESPRSVGDLEYRDRPMTAIFRGHG
ncbi:hypothetical protein RZS08_58075, partial [Arthrospira platensis SPKY1]|nr:hypothetical protein [Arthrospira platensis SPKY1]